MQQQTYDCQRLMFKTYEVVHAISQSLLLLHHTIIQIGHKPTNKHGMGQENDPGNIC